MESCEQYREMIMDIIKKIDDVKILKRIFLIISVMTGE